VAVTFPLSLAYYLIYVTLLSLLEQSVVWLPALATAMVPASVLNMAAMIFLFPLLRLLHRRTSREEMSW